ncbi:MAG: O-antigen ligase family protein, partial [Anaerolineales bacterium]
LGIYFVDQLYHFALTGQSMFWTWIIALAASQVIYNDNLNRVIKGLLISLILLTLYVAIAQAYDWKSGWVPPLVVIGALLAIRYRKLVVFALPFVMAGLLYVAMDLIAADEYSWGTRVDAWKIVLEIGRASPLLGTGFANYYWYTPLFPIRGYPVSFNSHSQFIDLIVQTGYLGLLGFFWMFFELGRLSWKLSNALPDGFARAYAYGVFAGIVASIVAAFLGDWVLPFVYNVGLNGFRASILAWIFMGGVISLEQMFLTKPAE